MIVKRLIRLPIYPVLALDLGDTTGWAISLDGRTILRSGIVSLKLRTMKTGWPEDEHPGARLERIRRTFHTLMSYYKVRAVAWELIVNSGGMYSKASLFTQEGQVVENCWLLDVEPKTVAPGTLKKFATCTLPRGTCKHETGSKSQCTGNGKATKDELRIVGVERWPGVDFKTHDEIDARWILDWYLATV